MHNKNFEVYFDFGASQIRAVAFDKNDSEKKFFYESNQFFDYKKPESEIEKIISNMERDTNEYLDSINLMIDDVEMLSVNLSIKKNFDLSKLKKKDIQFLIQDAKQQILRNYLDYSVIHIIIKNYKINNIDYTFFPSDIVCNSLSIDIIFICLPKKILEHLKTIFYKFDISINQTFCSSYIKSVGYKKKFLSVKNISFVDIGFNKTSIIFFNEDKICFFEVIPIGGNHITKDLSKLLNISLTEAENIKLYFNKNFFIKEKFSHEHIQKIIFSRTEEIIKLCIKSINLNTNLEQTERSKMILMGQGSKITENQFVKKIPFFDKIDLLKETIEDIYESTLNLKQDLNKQEVVMVPKKLIKEGFFEKLFHFFK